MHVVQVVGRARQLQVVGDKAVPEVVMGVMVIIDDGVMIVMKPIKMRKMAMKVTL